MKKFTKGCLMTALVLFIVGTILCLVCGLLGGFRQLNEMDGMRWIPFASFIDGTGHWRIGPIHSWGYGRGDSEGLLDLEDLGDMEDIEGVRRTIDQELEKKRKEVEGKKEQLPLTAETLGSLEIDVEECDVVIWKSEDEHAWIGVEGNSNRPHYSIENDGEKSELRIENEVSHHFGHWRNGPNDAVYLWLPEGCALEECDIDMGAGYLGGIFIKAKEMKVNVGAGMLETDGFEGEEVSVIVGAGEILADRITAGTAKFEIGAGHLAVSELTVSGEMDLDLSAGSCEIAGTIMGDLDLDCDMGETVMRLTGSEDDHSYDVECGMGNVTVGSYDHGGFAAEKSWNSGKNSKFDIDCNIGDVTITFKK